MTNTIRKSIMASLKCFENLFIEMTAKSCNQRCKHCYIDFPQYKKENDFIDIEVIQNSLNELENNELKCIYLTGAEPMNHPDFNAILRLCLKKSNVCICTNGFCINEKKARFLKKVENESTNEIIFNISLDHYNEIKNDDIRYRGAFRQAVFAIKHLAKHDFTPIITVTNYYNEPENVLIEKFGEIFADVNFNVDSSHICINNWHDKNSKEYVQDFNIDDVKLDCQYGRVLTKNGIYACPFLSDDYRGRCGSNINNFSKSTPLETSCCTTCVREKKQLFGIDFSKFEQVSPQ